MTEDKLRILRAATRGPAAVRIRRDRFEAIGAARRAIHRAEREAERILEAARQQAALMREEAWNAGREEGRRSVAAAEVALRAQAVRLREKAAERLVRLAVTLARQILDQELASTPESILALVRRAVRQVSWSPRARVRLHPDEARRLTEAYPALAAAAEGGAELEIRADAALEPGDCLVETDSGEVDGSVRLQLEALEQSLVHSLAADEGEAQSALPGALGDGDGAGNGGGNGDGAPVAVEQSGGEGRECGAHHDRGEGEVDHGR